jgi:glucuronate isomerase
MTATTTTTTTNPTTAPLAPHPDRLLPADPGLRTLARTLYDSVADARIFSPHGHVDARVLVDDEPFPDPAALLVTPDHYVTRVLHSLGIGLDRLGLGGPADAREIWRTFCTHWHAYLGTASRYWLEVELHDIFGIDVQPSATTADAIFDAIAARLAEPEFRPRALFGRFGIDVLATTDDPLSDLTAHAALAADDTFPGAVVPTFRPDRLTDPAAPGWQRAVAELGEVTGRDTARMGEFLDALRDRRRHFIAHGGNATDHGVADAGSEPLTASDAAALHAKGLAGTLDAAEAAAYRRNMLFEMARMSSEDGLVMQLHPGVLRNHHGPTLRAFGPDTGHDIPTLTGFAAGLRPMLEAFGTHPRFRLVLFTVDETAFGRDIAPLAGFYPSVFIGAPWWFLDAPDAISRFRTAVTETAGFYKTAGFVDDTRAYCSIPARHDLSRRVDASYLARLVAEHRISEDDAHRVIHDLVVTLPRAVFTRAG